MKCTVSPSALSTCIGLAARAVSPRSTLPVLSNLLIEAKNEQLTITATNLDLSISTSVEATVLEEGRTTIPARLFSDYVASLPEVPCALELDPTTQITKITCGTLRTNMHGIDAAEFPPLAVRQPDVTVQVGSEELERAIAQTAMAASSDEASPVLTGVLLQIEGTRLTLAATDRHRLAVKTLEVEVKGELPKGGGVIVPARHLSEVARAINPSRPVVGISFAEQRNQIFFTIGNVEITSRLIDGNYPNYAQVIPSQATTTVSLDTDVLLRSAKTASVLARDAANPVRLHVADNMVTLIAKTAEVGDHEAPLNAKVTGDDVKVAFNAKYMLDALSVLGSDEVQLSFNGALQPGVIRPVDTDDYLCIIMPVRVP